MGTSRIELTARWRWLPSSELQVGAPPWGLTKADRAENSKTRLKQLALWLFVVVLIVVWFRVNKLWNIFLLFTAHVFLGICKQFWRAPQRNTKHGNTRKFLMPETYPKNEVKELRIPRGIYRRWRQQWSSSSSSSCLFESFAAFLCKPIVTCDFSRQVPQRWPR